MASLAERYDQEREHRSVQDAQKEHPVPERIRTSVARGRERKADGDLERDEIIQFWRGNQYVYRLKGKLQALPTVTNWEERSGKAPHRMRTVRNLMLDIIAHEVSAGTSRIPSFEIGPSTTDPEDIAAARLAEKVALYGYDKWSMRKAAVKVITLAALTGEGFAWPYFDPSVGPYIDDGEGGRIGVGEIKIRTFSGKQVMWEPGMAFEDSPWIGVDVGMSVSQVQDLDGFVGGPLVCDSDVDQGLVGPDKPKQTKLVRVTHYLERPSPKAPNGRWLVMANNRVIVEERAYPCRNHKGQVLDEPVLHKLSYFTDPDNDRDFGLGRHVMDPQRSFNDIENKLLEWKNIALVPQLFVTPGFLRRAKLDDEPGRVYEVSGDPNTQMKWRELGQPPEALFRMRENQIEVMGRIAAQNEIPAQVESGKGLQVLTEKDLARRGEFIQGLAEWWSRLTRHCLYLAQRHYTEADDRLMSLQGRRGPELLQGFKGADLRGQMDVRVFAASLEPQTREAIERRIMWYAQLGWISPEVAMSAMAGGTAGNLVQSYELDVAWANRTIQMIVSDPERLMNQPMRVETRTVPDPNTGAMVSMQMEIPRFAPRKFQNVGVIKTVFEDWMKTVEYEQLDDGMVAVADKIYEALEAIETEKAAQAAMQQQAMAESQGMDNAAKPQMGKPMPSMPGPGQQLQTN